MDDTTLGTINNSVEQINNRMCDLNKRLDDLHNRCDETNITLRLLITENNNSHRDINRKIDQACRLISNVEKESSICTQKLDDHLKHHQKEDNRANINGVKITSLIGSFGSATIGAIVVLCSVGII